MRKKKKGIKVLDYILHIILFRNITIGVFGLDDAGKTSTVEVIKGGRIYFLYFKNLFL